jgi:DMSO reductase anchor subunit
MRDPKDMPPVPRDHDQASFSELMPIRSSKINLRRSPLLIFVLLTAVVVILSFGMLMQIVDGTDLQAKQSAFTVFAFLVTAYLLAVVLLVVYLYSKSDKPLWAYGLNFLFVCVLLVTPLGPAARAGPTPTTSLPPSSACSSAPG